jgi:thermitase
MIRLAGRAALTTAAILLVAVSSSFANDPEAVPGEYIVKLKEQFSVQSTNLKGLGHQLGAYIKSTMPENNIVVVRRPVVETQRSAVKSLSQNELVEYAEPNFIYHINRLPNDPKLGQLWGMKNTGAADSTGKVGVSGVDIGAEQAWDIQTGSKDVIIAVIDTGTSFDNEDLKDNMWTNQAELNGKPGVDDDGNGVVDDIYGAAFIKGQKLGSNRDDHGHGSHCSGTIGARGDDGKGIVGVAWNTRIMGVKFLDAGGSGTLEDAILAIDYATKMGAKIMSNSWGGGGFSQTLKDAITRSNAAGALFVAAAGNESNNNDSNPSYPASYDVPNVLAVAAIDNQGQLASFSSYGRSKVHVGAPGVNILSSTLGGKYESWSGTSMATPHVSGIAGLIASQFPTMTNVEIKQRIVSTARPIAGLRGKVQSGGLANAYLALTNTQPEPDKNDPVTWATVQANVSSEHPYKDKAKQEFAVNVPDAKQIAIYFSKFETEATYDTVKIYDSKGALVQTISGSNSESFSVVIDGNSAKLVFQADDSVSGYGFDVSKIAWR